MNDPEPISPAELFQHLSDKITANNGHPYRDGVLKDYYDGANDGLSELAMQFGVIESLSDLPVRP
jgi:hypothetical protein